MPAGWDARLLSVVLVSLPCSPWNYLYQTHTSLPEGSQEGAQPEGKEHVKCPCLFSFCVTCQDPARTLEMSFPCYVDEELTLSSLT